MDCGFVSKSLLLHFFKPTVCLFLLEAFTLLAFNLELNLLTSLKYQNLFSLVNGGHLRHVQS